MKRVKLQNKKTVAKKQRYNIAGTFYINLKAARIKNLQGLSNFSMVDLRKLKNVATMQMQKANSLKLGKYQSSYKSEKARLELLGRAAQKINISAGTSKVTRLIRL